jgi:RNA polymerase-interacting CarD/CdnL/TRCF family regulator
MNFDDFVKYFSALNVCKTKDMHEVRVKGKFIRILEEMNITDQVMSKWFYHVNIQQENTKVMLGIHQVDQRIARVLPKHQYLDTSFLILKRTEEGTVIHESQNFMKGRDCEMEIYLD